MLYRAELPRPTNGHFHLPASKRVKQLPWPKFATFYELWTRSSRIFGWPCVASQGSVVYKLLQLLSIALGIGANTPYLVCLTDNPAHAPGFANLRGLFLLQAERSSAGLDERQLQRQLSAYLPGYFATSATAAARPSTV